VPAGNGLTYYQKAIQSLPLESKPR